MTLVYHDFFLQLGSGSTFPEVDPVLADPDPAKLNGSN